MRAGIHVRHGAGQHADLADPVISTCFHAGQAEQQVDQEERKGGHQSQGEQVEGTFALHALVDCCEALAKALAHPVAQQKTGHEEGEGGADAGGEGDDQRAPHQAKHRTAGEREQCRTGKGEGGDHDVDDKVDRHAAQRIACLICLNGSVLVLERLEIEVLPEIEGEESGDRQSDRRHQGQLAKRHGVLPVLRRPGIRNSRLVH